MFILFQILAITSCAFAIFAIMRILEKYDIINFEINWNKYTDKEKVKDPTLIHLVLAFLFFHACVFGFAYKAELSALMVYCLTLYILFIFFVWKLAKKKGYDGELWAFLSVFLTPLIGLAFFILPPKSTVENIGDKVTKQITREDIECPFCGELILAKAVICKHCKSEINKHNL